MAPVSPFKRYIFPAGLTLMYAGQMVVCLSGGEYKRASYWICSILITWSVS